MISGGLMLGSAILGGRSQRQGAERNAAASRYAADKNYEATMKQIREQKRQFDAQTTMQREMYDTGIERSNPFYNTGIQANAMFNQAMSDPIADRDSFNQNYTQSEFGQRQLDDANRNALSQLEATGMLGGSGAISTLGRLPSELADAAYKQRMAGIGMGMNTGLSAVGAQTGIDQNYQNAFMQSSQNKANALSNIYQQQGNIRSNEAMAQAHYQNQKSSAFANSLASLGQGAMYMYGIDSMYGSKK